MQCAIGEVQLAHLPDWIKARRRVASLYRKHLGDAKQVLLPVEAPWAKHVYYVYTIRVPSGERDGLRDHLNSRGIATGIYYPTPVHAQPAITGGKRPAKMPVTDRIVGEILSLPMHPGLTEAQVRRIAGEVKGYFAKGRA
jgi:perosamine synthetase